MMPFALRLGGFVLATGAAGAFSPSLISRYYANATNKAENARESTKIHECDGEIKVTKLCHNAPDVAAHGSATSV